jgi:hypothetical protein
MNYQGLNSSESAAIQTRYRLKAIPAVIQPITNPGVIGELQELHLELQVFFSFTYGQPAGSFTILFGLI